MEPAYLTRLINDAILNSEELLAKSKKVVIERAPESLDLNNIIKTVSEECGVEADILLDGVHRHPSRELKDSPNKRPRIVKIPFATKKSRDIFLFSFRKILRKNTSFPQFLTIRRDMTKQELSILYEIRKHAYCMNQI